MYCEIGVLVKLVARESGMLNYAQSCNLFFKLACYQSISKASVFSL